MPIEISAEAQQEGRKRGRETMRRQYEERLERTRELLREKLPISSIKMQLSKEFGVTKKSVGKYIKEVREYQQEVTPKEQPVEKSGIEEKSKGGEEKAETVREREEKKPSETGKGGIGMPDDDRIAKVEKTVEDMASSVRKIGEEVAKIPDKLAGALTGTREKERREAETTKAEEARKRTEQERNERLAKVEATSTKIEAETAKLREDQENLKKVIAHYEKWVPEIGAACIGKTAEECEAMAKAELERRKAEEKEPEKPTVTVSEQEQRMKTLSEKKDREGEKALTAEEKKELEDYYWRFGEHGRGKGVALEEFLACEECFKGIGKKILENETYRKKLVEGLTDEERIKIASEACRGPACELLQKQLKGEGFRLRVEKESQA